nr:uncharacterized protein LOC108129450 [Drosophila bipectinata]
MWDDDNTSGSSNLKYANVSHQDTEGSDQFCCCRYCNGPFCLNCQTYSMLKKVCYQIIQDECPEFFAISYKKSRLDEIRDSLKTVSRSQGGYAAILESKERIRGYLKKRKNPGTKRR